MIQVTARSLVSFIVVLFVFLLTNAAPTAAQELSADDYVSAPNVWGPRLSPAGRYIAHLEREDEGSEAYIVITDLSASGASRESRSALGRLNPTWVHWANEDRILLGFVLAQAVDNGRGTYTRLASRIVAFDREGMTNPIMLFNENQSRRVHKSRFLSTVTDFLPMDADHILMPAQRARLLRLYRVNVRTGEIDEIEQGRRRTVGWQTNAEGVPVLRFDRSFTGQRLEVFARTPGDRQWALATTIWTPDFEAGPTRFRWAGWSDTPGEINVLALPDDADTVGIYRFDLERREITGQVAIEPHRDINAPIIDGRSGQYIGYSYWSDRLELRVSRPELQELWDRARESAGTPDIFVPVDRSGDVSLFSASGPDNPGSYHLFNESTGISETFSRQVPTLESQYLSPQLTVTFQARDGLGLTGYFTPALLSGAEPPPLIVYPHGGPEARDVRNYGGDVQYFASRGFSVFQPNFRGSSGYGRQFAEAGHGEWAGAMQTDIDDGIAHLIANGLADRDRICIVGFSYGGYAALAGATTTPDQFQCVAAAAGVFDLPAMLAWVSGDEDAEAYWRAHIGAAIDRDEASPRLVADRISIPVLLLHGETDQIVPAEQSQNMYEALQAENADVRLVLYPESGHNFEHEDDFADALTEVADFVESNIGRVQ